MKKNILAGKKIGFLGAGNMATAIIKGLISSNVIPLEQIIASDALARRRQHIEGSYGIWTTPDNKELVAESDIIVFAIKPKVCPTVLDEIGNVLDSTKLVLSIVAGVTVDNILSQAKAKEGTRVIRTIPNIPAMVMEGITVISADNTTSPKDLEITETIFKTVGRTVVMEENLMDGATGRSGSGPAYVFLMIDALADGGVRMGIPRETALILAAQTLAGASKFFLESGKHPGQLKDMVTTPGGTTIAGLHQLEAGGLRHALINAVQAATLRSAELGKP